jgi:outer membrane protein assembly factor BamD (BamD/ComL family)
MDAPRRFLIFLVVGLSPTCGCQSQVNAPPDPFAQTPQRAAEGQTAAAGQSVPGKSISQVTADGRLTGAGAPDPEDPYEPQTADKKPSTWSKIASALSPDSIEKSFKEVAGKGPNESYAKSCYADGDKLFAEKKYPEAAEKYAEAADRWPDSLLAEDALYMAGESYFFADQYSKARDKFDELTKGYENSRHLDRITARQFAIGRYWETKGRDHYTLAPNFFDKTRPWFDTHGSGIKVYEGIRLNDPTGPLADDAVMAQATAYFVDERHEDAAYQYEVLRKDYPQSEHQKQAHLLGLQSYMNSYQGPQYDVSPLAKAEKLSDHTLKIFGPQLQEEKARLEQAREAVRAQLAEREYDLGEYYRRLGYNRAARAHYANVQRDWPGTKFADLAKERSDSTIGKPDEPPDYFPWLTKWLGNRERR